LSFLAYDHINSYLQFQYQMTIFPTIMALTFYTTWAVGEYIDKETNQSIKLVIFLIVVFVQGSVSNLLQLTVSRFVFSFGNSEISLFSIGQALAGVGTAGLSLVLSYSG